MTTESETVHRRIRVLEQIGADPQARDELMRYNENQFDHSQVDANVKFPLPDEPHVAAWRGYADDAKHESTVAVLSRALVQLQFPIRAEISETDEYRSATRRGTSTNTMESATGVTWQAPDHIKLKLHATPAGTIPVLVAGERADFETLIQALTKRNEPAVIPESMGALMVAGYNNWDRVHALKQQWLQEHPDDMLGTGWSEEFSKNVVPHKELYQDKFIILSSGPYSGVAAGDLGMSDDEWQRLSLTIRLEHECAHYFTRRLFGSMQNKLLDELIADYCGIVAANGRFRADWFLRFVGLEEFPKYRSGGRLENYRGDPPLSDSAFQLLQQVVCKAAINLEQIDQQHADRLESINNQARFTTALTRLTLEELASDEAPDLFGATLAGQA